MPQKLFPARLSFVLDHPVRRWLTPLPERLRSLGVAPGMTVLELGCGTGFTLPALQELVGPSGRIVALDLQPALLEKARQKIQPGASVELRVADATQLELPDQSVDLVLAHFSFHEFTDRAGVVREARRVLRKDGQFALWQPHLVVDGWRMRGWEGLFWGQQFELLERLESPLGRGLRFKAVETPRGSRLRPPERAKS